MKNKVVNINAENRNRRQSKIIFYLINFSGLFIKLNSDAKRGIWWRIYLFFVILISLNNALAVAGYLYAESFTRETVKNLNLSDDYVSVAVAYIIIANRPINTLVNDVWKMAQNSSPKLNICFWFWFGLLILWVDFSFGTIKIYYGFVLAIANNEDGSADIMDNLITGYVVSGVICSIWSSIFCWFVLLNIFLLSESFAGLNNSFKDNIHKVETAETEISFLRKHLEISELVDRFNDTFSPAIAVLLATKMMQIISAIDHLKSMNNDIPLEQIEVIFFVLRSVVSFIALIELGQSLRNNAGEGINILFKYSLHRRTVPMTIAYGEENATRALNCQVSTLFASRNVTSPVVISASRILAIDYTLYLVMISVAVTYSSVVTSLLIDPKLSSDGNATINSTFK